MIPVSHQQGGGIGLKFGKQLHHGLGFSTVSDEYFHVGIIDGIGILRHAGINELGQFVFQAQPVQIHLHVVGNLIRIQAGTQVDPLVFFILFLLAVKSQILAAFLNETQRRGFQIHASRFADGLGHKRSDVLSELLQMFLPHFFNSGITHIDPPELLSVAGYWVAVFLPLYHICPVSVILFLPVI